MKYRLMDILCCPHCGGELQLHAFKEEDDPAGAARTAASGPPRCTQRCALRGVDIGNGAESGETRIDCGNCYGREITEGILECRCGRLYAIVQSVPRFTGHHLEPSSALYAKYKNKIRGLTSTGDAGARSDEETPEESVAIQSTFDTEWSLFDHSRDRAWGWNLDERQESVLNDLAVPKSYMRDKLLLDAGCGAGTLTAKISDLGAEVIGIDLTEGAVMGDGLKRSISPASSHLSHFVQGDLARPPFRAEAFDIIYSYGVLHHTSSTRRTFARLTPLIKPGGRMFVWLYAKRVLPVTLFFWHGRLLARHLPRRMFINYCRALAPLYKAATASLTALHVCRFRTRSLREITFDLCDAFTPRWNHTHSEREILGWFHEAGFRTAKASSRARQGTGVYGIKESPAVAPRREYNLRSRAAVSA